MKLKATIVILGIFSASCAGRDPNPVATVRATDDRLSCELMLAEYNTNHRKAVRLAGEKASTDGKNVALGVVGVVLFWPALFAMDLKGAERKEMEALRDRNEHLRTLMVAKRCPVIPKEVPIERDKKDDPKVMLPES